MASVRKYHTKSGVRWRVQYRSPDGKGHTKQPFTTKGEAEHWAAKNTTAIVSGEWVNPALGKTRVRELWEPWIASKGVLERSSIIAYENSWKAHVEPRWGDVPVKSVTRTSVQTWLAEYSDRATTGRRAHGVLSGVLELAVDGGYVAKNSARGVALPRKPQPAHVYLTPPQLTALAKRTGERDLFVLVLGTIGLRWGEAAGLQAGDLDVERRRIRVQRSARTIRHSVELAGVKTHEHRSVTAPASVFERLAALAEDMPNDAQLFTESSGALLASPDVRSGWFARAVREAVAAGELPKRITPHDLRHVAAGLLVSAGANVKVVQRQLGHKSAAMTLDTYSSLFDGDLDEVGDAMDSLFSAVVPLSCGTQSRTTKRVV